MIKTYNVTLKFEDMLVVEANSEREAVKLAMQEFDPTQDDPEVVDIWSHEDE
jgi:hypothetical protein